MPFEISRDFVCDCPNDASIIDADRGLTIDAHRGLFLRCREAQISFLGKRKPCANALVSNQWPDWEGFSETTENRAVAPATQHDLAARYDPIAAAHGRAMAALSRGDSHGFQRARARAEALLAELKREMA